MARRQLRAPVPAAHGDGCALGQCGRIAADQLQRQRVIHRIEQMLVLPMPHQAYNTHISDDVIKRVLTSLNGSRQDPIFNVEVQYKHQHLNKPIHGNQVRCSGEMVACNVLCLMTVTCIIMKNPL